MKAIFWPGLAFACTACVGVWAAYDRTAAGVRFGLIILGLLFAAGIVAWAKRSGVYVLGLLGVGCGLLAAAVGAYYLLQNDWTQAGSAKFAWAQQAGLWIAAHRPAFTALKSMNSNVAGSTLALLIPLGSGGVAWAWLERRRVWAVLTALAVLFALAVLGLTQNRGAWAGLGIAALSGGYLAWQVRRLRLGLLTPAKARRYNVVLLSVAGLLLVAVFWLVVTLSASQHGSGSLFGADASDGSGMSRGEIWQSMLPLVGDYPFTGSGLKSTMMVYSTYVLLSHVGYLSHAHNLFLQIAVEQGVPGLMAFVWLIGAALLGVLNSKVNDGAALSLRIAALAGLVVMAIHGMVDAVPYASTLVPVMFLPIGAAFAVQNLSGDASTPVRGESARHVAFRRYRRAFVGGGAACLIALVFLLPVSRAALETNLGAVTQTRSELSVYHWPEWPIQDALRRSPEVNLDPAIAYYQAALRLEPQSASANRRLGQIELSRGDYDLARHYLVAAYAAAPWQRATRQLLGESYALDGDVTQAAALWSSVDLSAGQLSLRPWWYEHIGEIEQAKRVAEAANLVPNGR